MDIESIARLARLHGIGDAYHDYRGELRYFDATVKAALLRAMGVAIEDPAAVAGALRGRELGCWARWLPPVVAARAARVGLDLNVPLADAAADFTWAIELAGGGRRTGTGRLGDCPEIWRGEVAGTALSRRRLEIPEDLPPGYHELTLAVSGREVGSSRIIVSPPECFEPVQIRGGGRLWGLAVQLYTVRSRDNWGIGDFADLERIIRWLAPLGAGFIGLNPLHALAPADPARASPYSASSRRFLNVLYIAVPRVEEFATCAAARRRCEDEDFRQRLARCRADSLVDYPTVAALKLEILALLHEDFRVRHLANGSARAREFRDYVTAEGVALDRHACFDALDMHLRATRGTESGWQNWPEEFRDPGGPAVERFRSEHAAAIDFQRYLQWLAHRQLDEAQRLARELGMPIGLYGDYAVGASPSGSETWADRDGYRLGAEIGAPPDPLALKGQGWGIPPQDPVLMEERRLGDFIDLIRANMRHYGALRLDHVMSLFRLWWVPAGGSPAQGAYVHYPLYPQLAALTVESWREQCLVVGEDLGVVPEEMRRAMPEFGVYHYKVLLFERDHAHYRRPGEIVRRALATVTTHDMPTLRSFWEGQDIELRRALGLYPDPESADRVAQERERERAMLLAALRAEGLAPSLPAAPTEPFTADLAAALHAYLSRSSAALAAVQIEDLLGMVDPVNVPGTHLEYPNWRRKLCADLEDVERHPEVAQALAAIARERPRASASGG